MDHQEIINRLLFAESQIILLQQALAAKPKPTPAATPEDCSFAELDVINGMLASRGLVAVQARRFNAHCIVGKLANKHTFKITRKGVEIKNFNWDTREASIEDSFQTPEAVKKQLF